MRIQLIEACGTCLLLTILALGSSWDGYEYTDYAVREASVTHSTWEFQHLFGLNDAQTVQIKQINYEFYDKITDAYAGTLLDRPSLEAEISSLMTTRQQKIMQVLNDYQRSKWHTLLTESQN